MNNFSFDDENKIREYIRSTQRTKLESGISAHSKHIKLLPHMKQYIKMIRYVEMDTVIQLESEPFDTLDDAQHFADCFNDSFLADAECRELEGKYYVYSGWMLKDAIMSYSNNSKGYYFEFANWS